MSPEEALRLADAALAEANLYPGEVREALRACRDALAAAQENCTIWYEEAHAARLEALAARDAQPTCGNTAPHGPHVYCEGGGWPDQGDPVVSCGGVEAQPALTARDFITERLTEFADTDELLDNDAQSCNCGAPEKGLTEHAETCPSPSNHGTSIAQPAPSDDEREALAQTEAERRYAFEGTHTGPYRAVFEEGAAWQRRQEPIAPLPTRDEKRRLAFELLGAAESHSRDGRDYTNGLMRRAADALLEGGA